MVTAEEEQENWAFINACMQTKVSVYLTLHVFIIIIHQQDGICDSLMETILKLFSHQVMKKAHQYLASKHKVSSSEHAFKLKLYELWFKVSCNQ